MVPRYGTDRPGVAREGWASAARASAVAAGGGAGQRPHAPDRGEHNHGASQLAARRDRELHGGVRPGPRRRPAVPAQDLGGPARPRPGRRRAIGDQHRARGEALVKGRALTVGWIVMVLVVLAALGWTVAQTISLGRSGATADTQRAGLARDLDASRQKIQAELVANADLLKDIRWSPDRTTAADVLRRLADLARGGQAKVLAIAPLEQEPAARYRKSSHRIDMAASFSELLDFATRVESEGGILEDVVLENPLAKSGGEAGPDAVRAQLLLTTIEPSDDTRRIMERVLAASAKSSKSPLAAALSLPIEARAWSTLLPLRDPFKFPEAPRPRGPAGPVALARPPSPASPAPA